MKIAIYGRTFSRNFNINIQNLIEKLEKSGVELIVHTEFKEFLSSRLKMLNNVATFQSNLDINNSFDLILSIGGDGTMLDTITYTRDSGVPVLGINTGRLGFLSSVSMDELDEAVKAIVNKDYHLEKRSLIKVKSPNNDFGDFSYALNELTVNKKDTASMMTIDAFINDNYLNTYWADGLIISTPTGSTAYSLSCGGPIIVPDAENFVITPIAPHNLNVRPIIVSDKSKLTLKLMGRSKNHLASLDGRSVPLSNNSILEVSLAPFKVNLVRLNYQNFLETLRNKLMWGLDIRN
jgi:NAD+ kinase